MTTNRRFEIAVDVRELAVSFARWGQVVRAIDRISVTVRAGEWVLLIGDNGAGKSTLLKSIGGQLRPDRGRVLIFGESVYNLAPRELARTVYMLHQDPLLGTAPLLTVLENLLVSDALPEHRDVPKANRIKRYLSLLEPAGLCERINQPAKLLSGGERQFLALIIARLRQANVILLDEPLAALDPSNAELCVAEIKRMNASGKTIIQISHEIRALRPFADRVLTMDGGHLLASAATRAAVD